MLLLKISQPLVEFNQVVVEGGEGPRQGHLCWDHHVQMASLMMMMMLMLMDDEDDDDGDHIPGGD